MKKLLPLMFLIILFPIHAYAMSNGNYILDVNDNLSTPNPTPTPETGDAIANVPQNPNILSGNNYIAYISYDNDMVHSPLLLTLSSNSLNFGKIEAGEALIRTQSLKVLPSSNYGYQVVASENHNLTSDVSSIPDSSCDSGNCTNILSDLWENPLTYGFGYRCDDALGNACVEDMQPNYYKRFSDQALGETETPILYSDSIKPMNAVISYKLNIAGNQAIKAYQNIINYTLIPRLQ